MTSNIANNPTAQAYKKLEDSISWGLNNDAEQIGVMQKMVELLSSANGSTVIRDWGSRDLITGEPIVDRASYVLDVINRRIKRMTVKVA